MTQPNIGWRRSRWGTPDAPTTFSAHRLARVALLAGLAFALPAGATSRLCIDNDVTRFGNQIVGTTTVANVAVTNCGDQSLSFTDVSVHPATGHAFHISTNCATGLLLTPGYSCPVTIQFAPLVTGQTSGGVWLRNTTADNPDELLTFYGRGIDAQAGTASITFIPPIAPFGAVLVNVESSGLRVELRNPGPAALTPTRFVLNGAMPYDFNNVFESCGVGVSIPAGQSCFLTLYFRPPTAGNRFANLTIDAPQLASLAILPISGFGATFAPQQVEVVEYYDSARDHFFMTALAQEIQALDIGLFGGWKRTGNAFNAYFAATAGFSPVCRFYLPPGYGDSHFYSASPSECADTAVKFPFFVRESDNVFYVALPDAVTGVCPARTTAVFRVWNGRVDTNHRYTTSTAVVDQMRALGWTVEGYGPGPYYPIMCAP
ncbi:MAG: choice-of-anchor D domain-containing protein [Betaproteobacteria bacterium]